MYMVVFHSSVSEADLARFSHVLYRDRKSGANFLRCQSLDCSDFHYLKVTAAQLDRDGFIEIRIPHAMVLMIVGPTDPRSNPMGFVWEQEPPSLKPAPVSLK